MMVCSEGESYFLESSFHSTLTDVSHSFGFFGQNHFHWHIATGGFVVDRTFSLVCGLAHSHTFQDSHTAAEMLQL